MIDLIISLLPGLPVTFSLTFCALLLAFFLALFFTIILSLKKTILSIIINTYITLFTSTPLLVQFFLIYYGPSQFSILKQFSTFWILISTPWFCAMLTLGLNSAAYSTLLFYGAVKKIPKNMWQSCLVLGMNNIHILKIIIPYILKRTFLSYYNEIIIIFKSTALASSITLLEITGYSNQIFGQTYNIKIFIALSIIYLFINSILTILIRLIKNKLILYKEI